MRQKIQLGKGGGGPNPIDHVHILKDNKEKSIRLLKLKLRTDLLK